MRKMGKRDPNEIWDRSVLRKETANTKALYERELGAITKCYFCHPEKMFILILIWSIHTTIGPI